MNPSTNTGTKGQKLYLEEVLQQDYQSWLSYFQLIQSTIKVIISKHKE